MKTKTLITIIIILAIGIGIVAYFNINNNKNITADYTLPLFNKDQIDQIQIKFKDKIIDLTKSSTGWQINEKSADSNKINDLINAFNNIKISGPVSISDQYYDRFNLDEENGINLILKSSNKEILNLDIGKAGTSAGTTFFKPHDQRNVYLAHRNWNSVILKETDQWRDKTVWSFGDNKVAKIAVKTGLKTYEASKNGDSWSIIYQGISKTINSLDSTIKFLIASGFTTEKKDFFGSLTLYDKDNIELISIAVAKDETNYYLKKTGQNDIFTITKSNFDQIWLPVVWEKEK